MIFYPCHRGWLDKGELHRIAFGGRGVDDAIEAVILKVVEPGAIAAAVAANAKEVRRDDYDTADPANCSRAPGESEWPVGTKAALTGFGCLG